MTVYAGNYSEDLQDRYGNGYRNALVAVETLAGNPVTLYADRVKTAYVPVAGLEVNEIKADSKGNLTFFTDPGNYQIVVTPSGGSALDAFPVSVLPDPLETTASDANETITGVKDFQEPFRISRFTRAALLAKSALQGALATVTDTVRGVWLRGELAWWRINGSTLNVREFGAIGDNTQHPLSEFFATLAEAQAVYPTATALTNNIDGVAIQKAIDVAEAARVSVSNSFVVDLGAGQYRLNTPIDWKSSGIVGTVRNSGTRIYWDGAAAAPYVVRQNTQKSFNKLRNVAFYPGANQPDCWIDATGGLIDVGFDISYVHFAGCTSDAFKASSWVNFHPHHWRFDGQGGYGIRFTPGGSQNLSSFALDCFTLDNNRGVLGGSKGMVLIDNTADATNLGVFSIRNGRIEINTTPDPDWAIVRVKLKDVAPAATRCLALEVANVAYSDSSGAVGDCVLFRETSNTTGSEKLIINNFTAANMSQVLGGTWPADFPRPTVPANGIEHMSVSGGTLEYVSTPFVMRPRSISPSVAAAVQRGTDSTYRWQVDDQGKHSWGSGSIAVDTELSRVAANVLGVGADDCLRTGRAVTASRPAAATVGQGAQFFDTTLNKPIWSTGSVWVDATGATV